MTRASMTRQVIAPMLAKLVEDIPAGMLYEPKWDGFRAIVVRDGSELEIHSRNGKPMARYFPDLVAAFLEQLPAKCMVDGEIVVIAPSGRLDFFALQQRIHPAASRIGRLAAETPASFVAFDLLDDPARPFEARRAALERMVWAPPLHLTPITRDVEVAREWFERYEGAGLDGVIAKDGLLPYRPGQRVMFKIKHQRTADCVIAGYRLHKSEPGAIGSLMLGLYGDEELWPIGAAASFRLAFRRELLTMLRAYELPPADHPWGKWMQEQPSRWNPARDQPFVPLRPERVIEVRYDHMDGRFLRHPATFLRWRDDRDARSCTFEQLVAADAVDVGTILT
jgi:ATP-dependent DNA ligase